MPSTRLAPLSRAALRTTVRAARRCALAAAVATSLVAASCGGDDNPAVEEPDGSASATTTTAGATTTTGDATATTAPSTASTSASGPAPGQQFRLTISDFAYTPNAITIQPGVIVTWTNKDTVNHTVTADNGAFDQELVPGRGYGRPFNTPGTFTYHCKIHSSMTGTVTVQ